MKVRSLVIVFALLATSIFINTSDSYAIDCPNPKNDGATIGKILVNNVEVEVKKVNYPAGGTLEPPTSPLVAGVSLRHMPLNASEGSSLIVWHVDYKGCNGKLNVLNEQKVGFKFKVQDENGKIKNYSISSKITTIKGKYKNEWFRLNGERQLVFVTCTGKVINHTYVDNLVIIAKPI